MTYSPPGGPARRPNPHPACALTFLSQQSDANRRWCTYKTAKKDGEIVGKHSCLPALQSLLHSKHEHANPLSPGGTSQYPHL